MKLTKTIPAQTVTVKFKWVYKNYVQCTLEYKKIRDRLSGKRASSMCKCDWCKHGFKVDEWFALAWPLPKQYGPKRNWALCHTCADLMDAPSISDPPI